MLNELIENRPYIVKNMPDAFSEIFDKAPTKEPFRQEYFIEQLKYEYDEKCKKAGRPLKYHVETFGCQMNAKDSEKLAGILEKIGYVFEESEKADIVVYNTCTVRENANTKVYGRIGYLGTLKKKNPNMKIILCGCMTQESTVIDKLKQSYPYIDIIFGTHNIFKLAELLFIKEYVKKTVVDVWKDNADIVEDLPSARKFDFKAGVNIMYGCNNFCSYCIVPYVRGRERSRKPEDIIKEIETMVSEGIVEVMLLGQNVNSYGKNLEEPVSFAKLLEMVCKIDGLKRVRFMTPHPKDLSDELIEVIAKEPKICRHIHLPLQSGSSRLLQEMNRHYTKEDYLALVAKIRKTLPDVAVTTDIIVGYPNETEEDFNETIDVVNKVGFTAAYTFIYSKRNGTRAALIEDTNTEDVIKARFNRLLAAISDASAKEIEGFEGKTVEVLVEEKNTSHEGMLSGRLSNNLLVHFYGDESLLGKLISVKITECKGFYFIGEII